MRRTIEEDSDEINVPMETEITHKKVKGKSSKNKKEEKERKKELKKKKKQKTSKKPSPEETHEHALVW